MYSPDPIKESSQYLYLQLIGGDMLSTSGLIGTQGQMAGKLLNSGKSLATNKGMQTRYFGRMISQANSSRNSWNRALNVGQRYQFQQTAFKNHSLSQQRGIRIGIQGADFFRQMQPYGQQHQANVAFVLDKLKESVSIESEYRCHVSAIEGACALINPKSKENNSQSSSLDNSLVNIKITVDLDIKSSKYQVYEECFKECFSDEDIEKLVTKDISELKEGEVGIAQYDGPMGYTHSAVVFVRDGKLYDMHIQEEVFRDLDMSRFKLDHSVLRVGKIDQGAYPKVAEFFSKVMDKYSGQDKKTH